MVPDRNRPMTGRGPRVDIRLTTWSKRLRTVISGLQLERISHVVAIQWLLEDGAANAPTWIKVSGPGIDDRQISNRKSPSITGSMTTQVSPLSGNTNLLSPIGSFGALHAPQIRKLGSPNLLNIPFPPTFSSPKSLLSPSLPLRPLHTLTTQCSSCTSLASHSWQRLLSLSKPLRSPKAGKAQLYFAIH